MSLNKVMLIGNVGKDPEVRYIDAQSGQGRKVAQFTLATSERYRDRGGELRESTEWHNIVVWGYLADTAEKYIKKGTLLYIEGKIRTRSYNDQSGNKRNITEIVADALQLLGRKESSDSSYSQPSQNYSTPSQNYQQPVQSYQQPAPNYSQPVQNYSQPTAPVVDPDESDDLPF